MSEYTTGELAKLTDVSIRTIQYYDKKNILKPSQIQSNGRRIYTSKQDLVAALNVKDIKTIEQFEGLTRTTSDSKTTKLLGLFVNLADYQLGCVKGGEITRFEDFDIDFNQHKLLLETRVSGALVELQSAIALEEDVTE